LSAACSEMTTWKPNT